MLLVATATQAQKEVTIKTVPTDAEIYKVFSGGTAAKVGVGTYEFKLAKDEAYTFEVRKEGYASVQKTFMRIKEGQPIEKIELTERIVKINASPADAHIYANSADRGTSPQTITIPRGQSVTVQVKKPGFVTATHVYYNKEGQDEPEISRLFKLVERVVSIKVQPADAAIIVDDKKIGEGTADVIIPLDKCKEVKVEKRGFLAETVTYCNKESEVAPPISDNIRLKTILTEINTQPEDAAILIDGKEVAKGTYLLKVPEGKCTDVTIRREKYLPETRKICNQTDMQVPDAAYVLKLVQDEAYSESQESDKANVNFSIEVNPDLTEKDAWKVLNSIIQSYFDEVQTVDAATGYLRTNWVVARFNTKQKNSTVIRTRALVTTSSISPLKYNLKIQSEKSVDVDVTSGQNCSNPAVNRDECFEPWPRILRKYNDLISEIQRRLQAR